MKNYCNTKHQLFKICLVDYQLHIYNQLISVSFDHRCSAVDSLKTTHNHLFLTASTLVCRVLLEKLVEIKKVELHMKIILWQREIGNKVTFTVEFQTWGKQPKKSGFNRIQSHDLHNNGGMRYQLQYEVANLVLIESQ